MNLRNPLPTRNHISVVLETSVKGTETAGAREHEEKGPC